MFFRLLLDDMKSNVEAGPCALDPSRGLRGSSNPLPLYEPSASGVIAGPCVSLWGSLHD